MAKFPCDFSGLTFLGLPFPVATNWAKSLRLNLLQTLPTTAVYPCSVFKALGQNAQSARLCFL